MTETACNEIIVCPICDEPLEREPHRHLIFIMPPLGDFPAEICWLRGNDNSAEIGPIQTERFEANR